MYKSKTEVIRSKTDIFQIEMKFIFQIEKDIYHTNRKPKFILQIEKDIYNTKNRLSTVFLRLFCLLKYFSSF